MQPTTWGTDNAIGQLDLGQSDGWRDAPSASLTIELLSRQAWQAVGPFDESYPAYYEDADWAYRARLMGWTVAAEPAAEAFHVFGGFWDAAPDGGLSDRKLRTAVVGRLRFACKIAGHGDARQAAEELPHRGRQEHLPRAPAPGSPGGPDLSQGMDVGRSESPGLYATRRRIQAGRVIDDAVLFPSEATMPHSYTFRNAPVLTRLVRSLYAALLRHGKTRPVPETRPTATENRERSPTRART